MTLWKLQTLYKKGENMRGISSQDKVFNIGLGLFLGALLGYLLYRRETLSPGLESVSFFLVLGLGVPIIYKFSRRWGRPRD